MELKVKFILKKIGDAHYAIPVGTEATNLHGLIKLNDTGVFLLQLIEKGKSEAELLDAMLETYEVSEAQAKNDLAAFLTQMREASLLG